MPLSPREATAHLVSCFEERGYVRQPNAKRLAEVGRANYRKGSEVRLVFEEAAELRRAQRCLAVIELPAGKPFQKHSQLVLPLYSAQAVRWFLAQIRKRNTALAAGFEPSGKRAWHRPGRGGRANPK